MNRKQIIAVISLLGIAGLIIYLKQRQKARLLNRERAEQVAEHGYETAHDVLFPKKKRGAKKTLGT